MPGGAFGSAPLLQIVADAHAEGPVLNSSSNRFSIQRRVEAWFVVFDAMPVRWWRCGNGKVVLVRRYPERALTGVEIGRGCPALGGRSRKFKAGVYANKVKKRVVRTYPLSKLAFGSAPVRRNARDGSRCGGSSSAVDGQTRG